MAPDTVRKAVELGILNTAQAEELSRLALASDTSVRLPRDDEPFEVFSGFSDIFIAVGLLLSFTGVGYLTKVMIVRAGGALFMSVIATLATMALIWLLAEYFTRRRRMTLPSIVLATLFARDSAILFITFAAPNYGGLDISPKWYVVAIAGGSMAMMLVYYRRFRLPFATFLIGIFGGLVMFAMASLLNPDMFAFRPGYRLSTVVFDLRSSPAAAVTTLLFGLAAFAAAMHFDLRDPDRVTRNSASAFWLHLLAAPALVNTLAFTLYQIGGPVGYATTVMMVLLAAFLALVINRRSFLTAGLVYVGALITIALHSTDVVWSSMLVVLFLGLLVTGLGTWWSSIRSLLLRKLPGAAWKARLPPYRTR